MKKIIIIGTGGNCIDILDIILDINDSAKKTVYSCVGFLDDNPSKWDATFHGVKVLGPLPKAVKMNDCYFVFGIGSPTNFWKRQNILKKTGVADEKFETIIHPTASISRMAKIGRGTVVFQNVTIASNVNIGMHVYILPNSVISHDTQVGDYTCIAGGVSSSGDVKMGQGCYIGTNSSIKEGVKIGDNSLIGMGSVVIQDVPENYVVAGSPARFLRYTRST
jgi:sugar O-acyltransferase (sialic acid O-acetyltransferase NeuD family)